MERGGAYRVRVRVRLRLRTSAREEEEEKEELAAGPGIDLGTLGGNQVMGGGLEKNKGLSGVHAWVLGCAEKQQRYRSIYPAVSN
jgi:hypothetical protein